MFVKYCLLVLCVIFVVGIDLFNNLNINIIFFFLNESRVSFLLFYGKGVVRYVVRGWWRY